MRLMNRAAGPVGKPATACDVMTPNPKSISEGTTVREVARIMQKHALHIAPVIDMAGRPIGVVSRTDLLRYWNRRQDNVPCVALQQSNALSRRAYDPLPGEEMTVRDIMTPLVFEVSMHAPIASGIEKMLALEVRCLVVTDEHGVLVGTVSVFDVLRHVARSAASDVVLDVTQTSGNNNFEYALANSLPRQLE